MSRQENHIDRARVAAPCPASWESMSGNDAVRFCNQCQLHVYNIPQMTRSQAETLITHTEGRICVRIYRRADGTVLTKDCPVGLRALRRRITKIAGAAFTALLSLSASVLGQTLTQTSKFKSLDEQATITRTFFGLKPQQGPATFWGVIKDPRGDVMPDVKATIINEQTKYQRTVKSDKKGQFKFGLLEPGTYAFKFEASGFQSYQREHLRLYSNEELRFDVVLDVGGVVGVVVMDELPSKGIMIDGVHVSINDN